MLQYGLSQKETKEVLLKVKEDIIKVVEAVVNDCIDTPTDKEEFIEAGLNVSYRLISRTLKAEALKKNGVQIVESFLIH